MNPTQTPTPANKPDDENNAPSVHAPDQAKPAPASQQQSEIPAKDAPASSPQQS